MNLNMSKFKKLSEDNKSATFMHPAGHKITVAKHVLSPGMRGELSKMPLHYADNPNQVPYVSEGAEEESNKQQQGASDTDFPDATPEGNSGNAQPQAPVTINIGAPNQPVPQPSTPPEIHTPDQVAPTTEQGPSQPPVPPSPPSPPSAPLASQGNVIPGTPPLNYPEQIQQGIQGYQQGQQELAGAVGQQGQQQAEAYNADIQKQQQMQDTWKSQLAAKGNEIDAAIQDYKQGHINPNQYLENMGVGQKMTTAIGLILGGMGGGLTHQANPALEFLNAQINRNVQGQVQNMNKQSNLVSAYMDQYHNINTATSMAAAFQHALVADQINMAAAKSASPTAQAQAKIASSQFQLNSANLVRQAQMSEMLFNQMQQNPNSASGGGSTAQTTGLLNYMRVANPEMAKSLEQRFIPGVGTASVPVPDKTREELVTRQSLDNALSDLSQFAQKNQGSMKALDPAIVNEGVTKAAAVQDLYRRANGQGVFREAEKEFVNTMVDQDPTKFFASFRTLPKYKAVQDNNLMQLNSLKQSYGLPTRFQPKSAQTYTGQ